MDGKKNVNSDEEKVIGIEDIAAEHIEPQSSNIQELAAEREEENLYYAPNVRMDNAKAAAAEEYVEVLKQDRKERAKYAGKLFVLICAWLISIYLIIISHGLNKQSVSVQRADETEITYNFSFDLSDTVLLALIGGTTINVLGLFVIVANYLFNQPKPPEK